jgi:hypothetical protein
MEAAREMPHRGTRREVSHIAARVEVRRSPRQTKALGSDDR